MVHTKTPYMQSLGRTAENVAVVDGAVEQARAFLPVRDAGFTVHAQVTHVVGRATICRVRSNSRALPQCSITPV